MDKNDLIVVNMLKDSINFYGETLAQVKSLHELAVNVENEKLAEVTQGAIGGLDKLITHFRIQYDAILKRNNTM